MRRRLVIFDCDGTLVDSQNAIVAAMTEAFKSNGVAPPARSATLSIVGLSLIEAVTMLHPGGSPAAVAGIAASYKDAFTSVRAAAAEAEPLFPGAREIIARLAGRSDIVLGIATGKSQRGVRRLIERERWTGVFATIQTSDKNPSKPHPAMIEAALAETGSRRADASMIGDTTFDIEMARAARIAAIGVAWGYHPVAHLRAAGAHAILESFAELPARLDREAGS